MKLSEIVKEQMSGGVQAAPSAAKPKIRSRSTGGQWQNGQTVPGTAPASGGVAQQPGSNPTSGGDPAGAMAQQQDAAKTGTATIQRGQDGKHYILVNGKQIPVQNVDGTGKIINSTTQASGSSQASIQVGMAQARRS